MQDRIFLESEAILLILEHIHDKDWTWVGSEVLEYELGLTKEKERKNKCAQLLRHTSSVITISDAIEQRASKLEDEGCKALDALHRASAEASDAEIFLTTDDKLVRRAKNKGLRIEVMNPLDWLAEILQ